MEVITRGERRRAWTLEQKREIVAESLGPELSATEVARKHGIRSGQLYTWRQQLLAGPNAVITRAEPRFAEVELTPALSPPEPASLEPGRRRPGDIVPAGGADRDRLARRRIGAGGCTRGWPSAAAGAGRAGRRMITLAPGLRVYLACGVTDMRKGMIGLAMLVQQSLADNPFDGAVYAFRGRRAGLIKLIWHDGVGLCMLTKRLERGQFLWPSTNTTGRIA